MLFGFPAIADDPRQRPASSEQPIKFPGTPKANLKHDIRNSSAPFHYLLNFSFRMRKTLAKWKFCYSFIFTDSAACCCKPVQRQRYLVRSNLTSVHSNSSSTSYSHPSAVALLRACFKIAPKKLHAQHAASACACPARSPSACALFITVNMPPTAAHAHLCRQLLFKTTARVWHVAVSSRA
jgi:hypothetical protein